jgi:hypothetical protein
MARAAQIVALRALGLGLSQVARALDGDPRSVNLALAAREQTLEGDIRKLATLIDKVRGVRADLARGQAPVAAELAALLAPRAELSVTFELPWPWAGERFELTDIRPINYIVGPLGSGKTRLAQRLAAALPAALFLGLERLERAAPESDALNLADVGPHEAIILCPANHSPPTRVAAYPGAPGYEAVATCLASPEVRARTAATRTGEVR